MVVPSSTTIYHSDIATDIPMAGDDIGDTPRHYFDLCERCAVNISEAERRFQIRIDRAAAGGGGGGLGEWTPPELP